MIIYDLVCECGYKVEAWFNSLTDYQQQSQRKLISCPMCNSTKVHKKLSAPYINKSSNVDNYFVNLEGESEKNAAAKNIIEEKAINKSDRVANRPRGDVGQITQYKRQRNTQFQNRIRASVRARDESKKNSASEINSYEIAMAIGKFIEMIVKNSEDVGKDFAVEARKIHQNRAPIRQIRGEATVAELIELQEEGIECVALPLPPKKNLN